MTRLRSAPNGRFESGIEPMNEPISLARRSLLTTALAASAAVAAAPSAGAQVSGPDAQRDLGDVLSCATIAAARSARIPADRTLLRLVGYHAPGDGGGALYRRVARAPAHALWFRSADGACWEWSDTRLDVRMAGAVGDGRFDAGALRILGGTDDTRAIQNAISAHCHFGLADACHFPNRSFRITAPLHAHYGTASSQCRLFGHWNYRGNNPSQTYLEHPSGTTLLCDFTEGMGISIAGSYGAHVKGLALIGRNAAWVRANNLGYGTPRIDDTLAANWIDPALPEAAGGRYSAYAGITVDAFYEKGRPAYPIPDLPAYLGGAVIDKPSTQILIEECYISGFVVGVADAPGGAPYCSDFMQIRRTVVERCQYGLSACQSQQRNLIRESCFYTSCYCAETTNTHGNADGTLGIALNISYAGVIHLFKLAASGGSKPWFNGLPILFLGCQGEALWRMGDIDATTPVETSLVFEGCSFSFDSTAVPVRGVPATMLAGFKPGSPIAITFRDTRLYTYPSVFPVMFDAECVSADGLSLLSNNGIGIGGGNYIGLGLRQRGYQRLASNATADGLVLRDGASRTGRMRLKFCQYDVDTRRPAPDNVRSIICGPTQYSERGRNVCAYMQRVTGSSEADAEGEWLPPQTSLVEKASLSQVRLSGRMLTFVLAESERAAATLALSGPLPGDVLIDQTSGSVFFVEATDPQSGTVRAILQNNYRTADGGASFSLHDPVDLASGTFLLLNARLYAAREPLTGEVEKGGDRLTLLAAPSEAPPVADSKVVAGDYLHPRHGMPAPFAPEACRVVAVTPDALTLDGLARSSAPPQQYRVFVRVDT